jgi:hypothetical protein
MVNETLCKILVKTLRYSFTKCVNLVLIQCFGIKPRNEQLLQTAA